MKKLLTLLFLIPLAVQGQISVIQLGGLRITDTTKIICNIQFSKLADAAGTNVLGTDAAGNVKLVTKASIAALSEPIIASGTTSQYWRGDKSWQTLDKAVVGLSNADNTSDANKPVSTAQQTALDAKAPITRTVNGYALSSNVTLAKSDVGLGNADNTSDANKPVSTAQATAIALKEDAANKSTSTSLGTSNTLFPTQNAVKTYVDNADALKENTLNKSNGTLIRSSSPTTLYPTQDAVIRAVKKFASADLGSPYVHYIADTPWVRLSGANLIDSLMDASGNNRHAWQATNANKATFFSSGGLNNSPYAAFNSSAPTKYTTPTITLDTNYTLFFVFKMTETIAAKFLLGNSSSANLSIGNNYIDMNTGAIQEMVAYGGNLHYCIFEVTRKGRQIKAYLNGVEMNIYNSFTTNTFNFVGIGGNLGSGTQFAQFEFEELICYNTTLNQEQLYNVRGYLFSKYGGKSGVVFTIGDSWTYGTGVTATQASQRWTSRLATRLGFLEINQGIPGTVLESVGTPLLNNGHDRRLYMPKAPYLKNGYAIIMYDGNSANSGNAPPINLTTYTPMLHKFQMATQVNTLLAYGWQRSQIILCTQGRFNGASQSRWDSFATSTITTAQEMNLMYVDLKTYFGDNIANNNTYSPPGDRTHPTATQHDTVSSLIENRIFTGWTKDSVTIVSASYFWPIPNALPYVFTGSTTAGLMPPVTDNAGYSIEIHNQGSGDITLNSYSGGSDFNKEDGTLATSITISTGKGAKLTCENGKWKVLRFN